MGRAPAVAMMAATLSLLPFADGRADDVLIKAKFADEPPPAFSVCHGFTCALVTETRLQAAHWSAIRAEFGVAAADAAEERGQIARAIAQFETIVGGLTGTSDDQPENGIGNFDRATQMDCMDESTNTTTYLTLLAEAGLLRWHRVEEPIARGFFFFGWPHWAALISEKDGTGRWVVDSWFHANGEPPVIVPVRTWRQAGWRPGRPEATAVAP